MHKIIKGFNAFDGYYDLNYVCRTLIEIVESSYNIDLPTVDNWFLQRCDIAICYDIKNQENVKSYINSLSRCNYPRRKIKFFNDESLYLSGTTTTLKIYNKLLEFKKHDIKKFYNTNFDVFKYTDKIQGFVRFECEVKKRSLQKIINKNHINVNLISYEDLKKVWCDEFMKLLQFVKSDFELVRSREDVLKRLQKYYKPYKANMLYNFFCAIQLNGNKEIRRNYSSSTYYRNMKDLKSLKIDFSQSYKVEEIEMFNFNPFEYEEVI